MPLDIHSITNEKILAILKKYKNGMTPREICMEMPEILQEYPERLPEFDLHVKMGLLTLVEEGKARYLGRDVYQVVE